MSGDTGERLTEEWRWVDTGYACGAVILRDGIVIDAAPIFRRWMMGRTWAAVLETGHVKRWKEL